MVYRVASGTAEKQLGLRLHKETSLSGLCVQVGHALQCSDSEDDPRVDKEACRKVGLRSMVVSPLKYGDIVDGLKQINDNWGHRAGDTAIQEFSLRIKKATRQTDTVARLGGDEFGIIVHTIKNDDDIAIVTQRIENALTQPFKFEGKEIPLHASMGWALFPNDGEELEVLIDNADRQMYTMKRMHKNNRKS